MTLALISFSVQADSGEKEHSFWSELFGWSDEGDRLSRYMSPVKLAKYDEECGACHWTYLPELLPASTWVDIMAHLEDHFTEDASLDPVSKNQIQNYLVMNSADKSGAKRAKKIMRSFRGDRYNKRRVTTVPYIIYEHRELSSSIYKRESIMSFSNCVACHRTADDGIFEDDFVKIPRN